MIAALAPRRFAPDSASFPTLAAAETFGIPVRYAYLLGDVALVVFGRSVWPPEHAWHVWAVENACNEVGEPAVSAFMRAMVDVYLKRYEPIAHAAKLRDACHG